MKWILILFFIVSVSLAYGGSSTSPDGIYLENVELTIIQYYRGGVNWKVTFEMDNGSRVYAYLYEDFQYEHAIGETFYADIILIASYREISIIQIKGE